MVEVQKREGYYSSLAEKKFGFPFRDDHTAKVWLSYDWRAKRGHFDTYLGRWWKLLSFLRREKNPYA